MDAFDLSVFNTDTITANININYGVGQIKAFKVTLGTLTWEEWMEPETAILEPVMPLTKVVTDDKGENPRKVANPDDIDYKRKRLAAIGQRNALRVIKALEKAGTKLEGSREEKIKRVMNNTAVFAAIWKVVNDSASAFNSAVEATADSFRAPTDGSANHEDVPTMGDTALTVQEPSLN